MKAIVIGPDRGLGDALRRQGVEVTRIEGIGSGEAMREAGIQTADVLVVTDVGEATSISVALELNPDLKTVAYSPSSIPEFVKGQIDLALDPSLLDPDVVAEELTGDGLAGDQSGDDASGDGE